MGKALGFSLDEMKSGDSRYSQLWTHPDGHILHSDGKWCHPAPPKRGGIYSFNDFEKCLGIVVPDEVKNRSLIDFWWDFEKKELPEDEIESRFFRGIAGTREMTESVMAWDWRTVHDMNNFGDYSQMLEGVEKRHKEEGGNDHFVKHVRDCHKVANSILKRYMVGVNESKELAKMSDRLSTFVSNCYSTITPIAPQSRHTPQDPDWTAINLLLDKVKAVCKQEMRDYEEE